MGLFRRLFGSRHVHEEVGSWFKEHLDEGLLLDLPAGDGVNSRRLASAGFEVIAGDLFPENVEGDGFTVSKSDLNEPLPFADEQFDGILFSEGIEHLDAQLLSLQEMARVLKPAGTLIVTKQVLSPHVLFGRRLVMIARKLPVR
jgi:ubiquinone/menaquinone biosynthesis C-methylase UbiE